MSGALSSANAAIIESVEALPRPNWASNHRADDFDEPIAMTRGQLDRLMNAARQQGVGSGYDTGREQGYDERRYERGA